MLRDGQGGWGEGEEVPVGQGVAEGDPGVHGSWGEVWEGKQQEIWFLKGGDPEVQLGEGKQLLVELA